MAVAKAKAAVPPASTFAELLRRSRFSSYDQAIAQTYTAPPAYARRGNYGLKRAIPMTYKDSYITVPTFEHHAQFTDWNNAEQQVKFLKRLEETNVLPEPVQDSSWDRALGEAQSQWLIDSEFAQSDYPGSPSAATSAPRPPVPEEKVDATSAPPPTPEEKVDDLRSFGKQGSGQYGSRRPLPTHSGVQLNIHSLSPKQFQRYLNRLRDLRPEFRAYITQQFESRYIAQQKARAMEKSQTGPSQEELDEELSRKDKSLLYVAAQTPVHKLHRQFLTQKFSKNYLEDTSSTAASSKIEAQPHRFGGLIYHHPSKLQSILTSSPLPGIAFQDSPQTVGQFAKERSDGNTKRQVSDYLVLFGDVLAKLRSDKAKTLIPLYYPDTVDGVLVGGPGALGSTTRDRDTNGSTRAVKFANSISGFRFLKYHIKSLPQVVSYKTQHQRPSELLSQLSVEPYVINDKPWHERNLDNPHKPGSPQYISHISTNSVKRTYSPTMYGSEMSYGSRFEEREARKRERENRDQLVQNARRPRNGAGMAGSRYYARGADERREQINSMGMGMGMGMGSGKNVDAARAKTVSTLNGMISGYNKPESRGVDENIDDEDLE